MTSDNSAKIFGKPLVSQYGGFAGFCWCISLARLKFSFLPVILTYSAHPGASHGVLCMVVVGTSSSSSSLLLGVCEEARTQTAGRGTELPLPLRCPARFD